MAGKKKENKQKITKLPGGKRLNAARVGIDAEKYYSLQEAVKMVKERAKSKFDETIDIAIRLGIDAAKTDQTVRGITAMPNGVGKEIKVAVFAKDKKADEAKKAGADIVGSDDLVEEIKKGKINFDRCIATPDMMAAVGSVAKILGPKGLMPNPKLGTVTNDVAKAVKETKSGQVEFKVEKGGIIHAGIGKASFGEKELIENIKALMTAINQAKPSSVKADYLKKISISSTMGPGIKLDISTLAA